LPSGLNDEPLRLYSLLNALIMIKSFNDWLTNLLNNWHINDDLLPYLQVLILLTGAVIITLCLAWITKTISVSAFKKLAGRTATQFDDMLLKNKVINYLSRLVPFIVAYKLIPVVSYAIPSFTKTLHTIADVYFALWVIWLLRSFLHSVRDFLKTKDAYKDKPVDSMIQVLVIFSYFIAAIVVFSIITGKSVGALLAATGAASAILLLIFKDSILGFVASIQVSVNDMVRIGDWITMDKYGADGDVIEINLTTVKVQNFDKTITTIPTYYLISDSFKNWRGMHAVGGRRIKRSVHIKVSSIKYLNNDDIAELRKIQLLTNYLDFVKEDIAKTNRFDKVDEAHPVNGRRLTNLGVYRYYVETYIQQHKQLHKEMTSMTRQLAPTMHGIPLELYVFTKDTKWVKYEHVMADIFDHILAAVPYFDLETYEQPNSGDIRYLATKMHAGKDNNRQLVAEKA